MTKNDGGPAFPVVASNGLGHVAEGMSIRDYFAAQVVQAYMAWSLDQPPEDGDTRNKAAARYAKVAYQIADAMLNARSALSAAKGE